MAESEWRLVGVRGATTVAEDTAEQISERTIEVLKEMLDRNGIGTADIVSVIFTVTPDLVSEFPAAAARELGLSRIPLLCSQEIPVAGSMERCIRVLMHAYSSRRSEEIRHPYLHEARQLRTDLSE